MTVISFLSDLHRFKKYQVATLLLARSAVTHFHVDPHSISSYGDIGQYLNRLKSLAPPIRLHRPTIDLTPTFNALRSEESTTITFVRLQRKLAFLLAFVCFLRLSNLDRIPFDSIPIQDNQILTFGIFSSKEKRGHRRIIKSFSVKAHTDPRLRPIATYQALVPLCERQHSSCSVFFCEHYFTLFSSGYSYHWCLVETLPAVIYHRCSGFCSFTCFLLGSPCRYPQRRYFHHG